MDGKALPAVRVPLVPIGDRENGEGPTETPIVDLPPSEKFGFAWPDRPIPAGQQAPPNLPVNNGESSEADTSDTESLGSTSREGHGEKEQTPTNESPGSRGSVAASPPRLNRAFSVPVASQLGHLNHPHKSPGEYMTPLSPLVVSQPLSSARFQELSLELADSVQSVIQTLLQVLPPHLLDPAKEQFAPCSLSVPSPSISAMLTAMKNLNYMSANLSNFTADPPQIMEPWASLTDDTRYSPPVTNDFDVGEMLQSVGDALSGSASQAGVDLVLFHADVGMKHVSVRGDECGMSYALSHVIRQVLDTAEKGDTIEVGLYIYAGKSKAQRDALGSQSDTEDSRSPSRASSSSSSMTPDFEGNLRIVFDIAHKFASSEVSTDDAAGASRPDSLVTRARPRLESLILRRLLRHIGAVILEDQKPRLFQTGRACELTILCETGSPELLTAVPTYSAEEHAMRQPFATSNIQLASEPSLEELQQFVETLKGKKVTLHASAKGSFAHHLSSYLTAWGLDVSHMSLPTVDLNISPTESERTVSDSNGSAGSSPSHTLVDTPDGLNTTDKSPFADIQVSGTPAFVVIDDDVIAFRRELLEFRTEAPFKLTLGSRPKLSAHHRPKSSPQVYRAKGARQSPVSTAKPSPPPVLIHFTSLSNFKIVKDIIHSIIQPNSAGLLPEVIVLPKPAGPRRVLTALRTALTKPIVDPFFSPIATSPASPTGQFLSPFSPFFHTSNPTQKAGRPSISPRTASDRSMRSMKDGTEVVQRLPPSPLRETDTMEYFSEAAEKLGPQSSAGLVIQSPDGNPAGIFFYPRGSGTKSQTKLQGTGAGPSTPAALISPPALVRDLGHLRPTSEQRRSGGVRRKTDGQDFEIVSGDRPKPVSRPQTLVRNATGFASEPVVVPIETLSSSPVVGPSLRRPRASVSPRTSNAGDTAGPPGLHSTPPLPELPPQVVQSGSPTSPIARTPGTAATSPQSKRAIQRRGTGDSSSGTPGGSKKAKASETNIVPPVNVLIVEDNPINQTILSTFMRKKRIKYDVAKNGAEGVDKWKTGEFHLILMDIQMPVMDGIEATKEIRRLEKVYHQIHFPPTPPLQDGQQTPSDAPSIESKSSSVQTPFRSSVIIVALTASALEADRIAALAAGCNDYLTKPVSLQWLNSKIIEWGSIKALQMWADLRPEVAKNISMGQLSQARSVANKLHVPEKRGLRPRSSSNPRALEGETSITNESPATANRVASSSTSSRRPEEHSNVPRRTFDVAAALDLAEGGKHRPLMVKKANGLTLGIPNFSRTASSGRPGMLREISGQEALDAHIKDSAQAVESVTERNAHGDNVILGERALTSTNLSIGEVMHGTSPIDDVESTVSGGENGQASKQGGANEGGSESTEPLSADGDRPSESEKSSHVAARK